MRIYPVQNSIIDFRNYPQKLARFLTVIVALAVLSGCQSSRKELQPRAMSLFESLESTEAISISISTDLQKLLDEKEKRKFQPATLHIEKENMSQSFEIKLKPRGKTRKNICDFPPLKLRFSEDDLQTAKLSDYTKLKLVTHCQGDEDLVLKELLAYKLYNILTEKSFKVQLAKISYVDESGETEPIEKYGFLIENTREMADRLNGQIVKNKTDKLKSIDAEQYRMLTLFQYMIGNTDWNLGKRHNIKMVKLADRKAPVPVPYDFDFAGLVNAPYANPHPQLPIQKVTDRFFQWRGKCASGFEETLEVFKAKKEAILNYCAQFEGLEESQKTEMLEYINSFYEIIEQEDKMKEKLTVVANGDTCNLS